MNLKTSYIFVLGMRVDMVQISNVICTMENWIKDGRKGRYIVISNANDAILSKRKKEVRNAVNRSDLSVPDGISLVLLGRFYGHKLKRRVYGPDLMEEFCDLAVKKGYKSYFYGGAEGIPERLKDRLIERFPGLKVTGTYSPPFKDLTNGRDKQIVEMINKANPDVLWVGLGCPKQQLWMYEHKDKLNVPVMVGVGAAFDFIAGVKKQAPLWMREHGLEWFFRLATEPKRLWKRYIVDGIIFLYSIVFEIIKRVVINEKGDVV